jgi:hypothetical protein
MEAQVNDKKQNVCPSLQKEEGKCPHNTYFN